MAMRMKDKIAVVTGGASGIGKRAVERIVEEGGRVVIADIQDDRGLRMQEDMGDAVRYIHCDVTVEDDIKAAIAKALHQHVWPLIEAGRVKPVIHSVFPAAQASRAHALMESSEHIGKIVLRVA